MRPSALLLLLPLVGLLCAYNVAVVQSCSIHSIQVALASAPALPQSPGAYDTAHVLEALDGLGSTNNRFLAPKKTTFACVDARGAGLVGGLGAVPTLETPGGDFSELTALIVAYHRVKKTTVTAASVTAIFNYFMGKVASAKRPFYMHTSDAYIQKALAEYHNLTGENVNVVPDVQPMDKESRDAWYESLSLTEAQGCGHIRHMMEEPAEYDLNTPAEVAVPALLIQAFFKYWWPTPHGSPERSKVVYPILQGSLGGGALSIVNNVGPGCPGQEPDLAPFHGGSTMFLYSANAATTFRRDVLIPFIVRYDNKISGAEMLAALTALQALQLNATLHLLQPLNTLPIYSVNVTTNFVRRHT